MTPTEIRQIFLFQTCNKADKLIKSELDKALDTQAIIHFEKVAHFYSLHTTFANEVHQVIKDNIQALSDNQIMAIAQEALATSSSMTSIIDRSLIYDFSDGQNLLKNSPLTILERIFSIISDSFNEVYNGMFAIHASESAEAQADQLREVFMCKYRKNTMDLSKEK